MANSYRSILTFQFKHEYYQSGFTPDLEVFMTPTLQKKLRNYRIQINPQPEGFELIQERNNSEEPSVSINPAERFRLPLILNNPDFQNFTKGIPEPGNLLRYKNANEEVLVPENVRLVPQLFNYHIQIDDGRIKWLDLKLFNDAGLFEKRKVRIENESTIVQVDFRANPQTYIIIQVCKGNNILQEENLICDNDLFKLKPFALLDLNLTSDHVNHAIHFETRSIPWKYYLILQKDQPDHTFKIEDRGISDDSNRYANVDLNFVEKTVDYPLNGAKAFLFESGSLNDDEEFEPQKIPLYEENKRNISIIKYPIETGSSSSSKYNKYSKKYHDDDDDDDDDDDRYHHKKKKTSSNGWFYYFMIDKGWWNKKLRRHVVAQWKKRYVKVKLKKPGKVVVPNVPKPSIKNTIPEVYIYL